MTLMNEKQCPSYPGYWVTDTGQVRTVDRIDSLGRRVSGRVLAQFPGKRGHLRVAVNRRLTPVYHLVLDAFVGPRPPGGIGRHLNDDPGDNRLENLAWGTHRDNAADRKRNGGYKKKSRCVNGHSYKPDNTWLTREGYQQCRTCHRERARV